MFRFNNPDALLVLLLVGGAYAITRALEAGRTGWLVLAFALVGGGFLAKMLQTLLVVPAFGFVYLVAAPVRLRRRIGQLVGATVAMVAAAGWWVAIVELTPASMRPYIGGSQTNSVLDLVFGYNGFGRLTGNETGSVGGGGGAGSMWGETGWNRMFNSQFGGQASWLIPAALVLGAALFLYRWRAPRTDRARAAVMLWGGWLLVTALVFSFQQRDHPSVLHRRARPRDRRARRDRGHRDVAPSRRPDREQRARDHARADRGVVVDAARPHSRLEPGAPHVRPRGRVAHRRCRSSPSPWSAARSGRVLIGAAALVVALSGPAAYSLATATTAHAGALPSAGPTVAGGFGGMPGGFPGGANAGGPPGGFPGGAPKGGQFPGGAGGAGGAGGLLSGSTASDEMVSLLAADSGSYRWVAATIGSNQASGYQLATGDPVMAIGGFNGSDPSPTLAEFRALVAAGDIHYFIAGGFGGFGGFGGGGSSGTSSSISTWVADHFTAQTVDGVTVYDLSAPNAS